MTVLTKLFTALRGAANEAGEAIIDEQALRILDQELREAKIEVSRAKGHLTEVMGQRATVERENNRLVSAIAEHEDYAAKALEKGDENLAEDVCDRIAMFEEDLALKRSAVAEYDQGLNQLKRNVKSAERNIWAMERQITLIKATDRIQKATETANIGIGESGSAASSARESLERIRKRQQEHAYRMEAAAKLAVETEGETLEQRLKDAGIIESGQLGSDVLARIRAKNTDTT